MLLKRINYKAASFGLLALLLAVILFTFRHYGISWDEGVHDKIGTALVRYYLGILRGKPNTEVLLLGNPVAYGGIFNLPVAIIQRFSPLDRFNTRHLINALVGFLGILGAWKTARLLASEKAAFWTILLLAIIPGYYGHMFFNPKDIPFAAGYIWSLYYILLAFHEFPKITGFTLLKLSIAIGATMAVRVGGVMVLGYFGLAILAGTALLWKRAEMHSWRALLRRVVVPGLIVGSISYGIMVAFWPWALQNPLVNPAKALVAQQHFDYEEQTLFEGQSYGPGQLPPDYIPKFILITMPEVNLLLLAAGLVLGGVALAKKLTSKRKVDKTELDGQTSPTAGSNQESRWTPQFFFQMGLVLLLIAIIAPVILVIVQRSVVYDGARHFIFILPPLAILAGISYQAFSEWLGGIHKWALGAANLVIVALVGLQVFTMIQLHPYEYVYYNSLVGGLKGAYQKYETDYWGLATSEAAKWLANYVETKTPPKKTYPVYTCANKVSASYYLPKRLQIVKAPENAHFGIVFSRWDCDQDAPGETLYTIERMGVPLAKVKLLY